MAKKLAKGQVTITTLDDAFHISQSVGEYVFPASSNGTIVSAVTVVSTVKVIQGSTDSPNFTIGTIAKPTGFSMITVDNAKKTITYSVAANTTTLADHGSLIIPILIGGMTYNLSFQWAKAKSGVAGGSGKDGYTVKSSRQGCTIATDENGRIHTAVTTSTVISALRGTTVVTPVIGVLPVVAGCSLTKSGTTVTIVFNTGTSLAEQGVIDLPVTVDGVAFSIPFNYAKARAGITGAPGVDANLLDWVNDWNTNKTLINNSTVVTPKIFAGVKNSDGTLTGMAIGRFALSVKNTSGNITSETVDGIYGFRSGIKTFFVDNGGNAQLGQGNQFIKYNAVSGRVEFGSEVSLNWINAINQAKTEAINSAATTAQNKADAAKNSAILSAETNTDSKISELQIGSDNLLPNGDFRYYSTNNTIGWDNALNGTYVITNWGTGYNSGVAEPSKGYHAHLNTAKFGFPVLELINKNSTVGQAKRWLGICTSVYQKEKLIPGACYTFTTDLMVDTTGMTIHGGVYSTKKGQSNANFSSTSYSKTTSSLNQWQRVSFTFTLDKDIDLTKSVSFYIYGYSGTEGIAWVKNVSLQLGTKGTWVRCQADVDKDIADAKKAGTDAQSVANAITNKANTEGWATKLTYIDKNGIFTGALSANTVNALQINATQITSGTIGAARIDVNALKASLITAGNIEALTLNVTKGKLGGWTVDGDSIYRGTKNNTAGGYTSASGAVTLGANGLRGFKWRLDATGAGALAGGNIAWDATGNVTFGASVTVQWTTPINSITTALGGASYPKLTKITAAGVYTGTVTASQITAGTISADRIAAGSINASKLDATSIKSSIINTDYISGLSCTFTSGKIGGWTIGANALTNTHIALDNGNKRIVVYGANSGVASGKRVQLYYSSDSDFGFYATDASGNCVARLGSANQIAGWIFNTIQIYKNNVYLGSDGTISNSTKWIFRNDGSGQIANGNISWDIAGTVSFSQAVSLNWKNDIEAAKSTNFGYRYYKRIVVNGESNKYYPVVIKGGDQTVKRDILIRRGYSEQAPTDWDNNSTTHKGGLILLLKTNFGGWGGAVYSWDIYELSEMYSRMFAGAAHCGNSCMFAVYLRGGGTTGAVYHIYSDQPIENSIYSPSPIPASPQIAYNSDLIFQSGDSKAYAPAPRTLTSTVENEIRRHRFIVLAQANDSTLTAHPLTYIGSTGIYTGTLTASQVNAVNISASSIQSGTLSADRIAAGSINASKLNAASIKSDIINVGYINGLTCTFVRGQIGGFNIGSDNMTIGSIGAAGAIPLQIRSVSVGSGYWYTGAYKPLGITLTWHQSSNAGHIVFGQVAASGNTVKSGFIGIQMMSWDHLEYFCLSANYTRSGSKEIYNRIAGWAFDHNHIWKNNISLSSDGSITNGSHWRMNNDGSGQVANGNISWNSSGGVTFSSSVSAQWTTGITTAQELAAAMAFGKMLYRDPTFYNGINSVGIYNNSGNGMVVITRVQDNNAPNDSKYVLKIQTNGAASPGNGGFYFGTVCSYRKVLIARIIAKIPTGHNIQWASNNIGSGGNSRWLTSNAGTGDWKEYIYKVVCGTSSFSSTHFYYIDGTQGSSSSPLIWYVAYATVFDLTSTEKYTTTIDSNGVYTGTVKANQVIVDSALVVGGSNYNGSISVRDAENNVKVTLDRSGITAVGGRIGGWIINASTICAAAPPTGHRIYLTNSGYLYNDDGSKDYWGLKADGSAVFGYGKISFAADGSGYVANQNIRWDVNGNVTMTGTINANAGTIGGFTIGQGHIGSTATGSGSGGGLAIYNDLFRVGNTVSYVLLGANTFPATSGGTAATGRIVNTTYNSYLNNYGLYVDVRNGYRNFGMWSNAPVVATSCIGNKIKNIYFTGSGYTMDFSQSNIFFVYANATYNVNLPSASSVASMFGYSSLPSDFAYVFTLVYNYNWGGHINLMNVYHQNGGTMNYGMERGDSVILLCANYPSFHYQIINYYS